MALCRESLLIYPDLASELSENTGIDPEWSRSGMIILDPFERSILRWCQGQGIRAGRIDPAESIELPSRSTFKNRPALWLPDIAQIRNPRLISALRADLVQKGLTLLEDTEALQFKMNNRRIDQVQTRDRAFSAGEFIIAAGAWSKNLARAFSPQPEIVPVKGQMLLYQSRPGLLQSIVLYHDQYLVPRRDGHILAGSTLEYSGYDKATTPEARQRLDSFARSILPSLPADSPIAQWAGLRPGSPSGIPYIGRHPVISNLSFNCGHFRNGFGMGPASARLLADLLTGRETRVTPEPYTLSARR